MLEANSIAAVYENHMNLESAVRQLERAAFDLKKISVLGKESPHEKHVLGYYHHPGIQLKYRCQRDSFWRALWGQLGRAAFFAIPGIGHILIAGPLVHSVVHALLRNTDGGLSAVGAGLSEAGVPAADVQHFEAELRGDKFLLFAHGTRDEMVKAREILHRSGANEINVHFSGELNLMM